MSKKISTRIYLLIVILIIASFFRLYNLNGINKVPPGLYPDEAMNGNNLLEALDTRDFKIFYPENNGREGLFINIQALSVKIFGNEPWALRLPSAIFGILTVLGIYLFSATLFSNTYIGLLSSFFSAISFWHINFSRIGFRAIMAPFFLVWGLYLLILAIKKNNTTNKPLRFDHKSWILAAFSGLIYGFGFYSYIAYRATPLLILVIFLIYWLKQPVQNGLFARSDLHRKSDLGEVFKIFSLFAFIAILPLAVYFVHNPQDFFGRTAQISIFSSSSPLKALGTNILKTAGMFNFSGDYNWRHNFAGKPELYWPVGIVFLFGIFYGIKQIIQKNGKEFLILFSWIFVASLSVVVSNESLPHALRSILMIPPVFVLAGAGAFKTYEILRNRLAGFYHRHDELIKNSFILICAALIIQSYNYYFLEWGQNQNVKDAFSQDYVEMGEMLNSLPKNIIKYVVVEANRALVRGIPMPAQTVMFITDTFTVKKQVEKNIHYILPGQEKDRSENNALFFYLK